MSATFSKEARKNILYLIAGTGGANLRVRLAKNAAIVDDDITLDALVEATYEGYAPKQSSLWSVPAVDTAGDVFTLSPTFVFQRSGFSDPNVIYCYYVTWDDGVNPTLLLLAERYTVPKPMNALTDEIPLQVLMSTRNLLA